MPAPLPTNRATTGPSVPTDRAARIALTLTTATARATFAPLADERRARALAARAADRAAADRR